MPIIHFLGTVIPPQWDISVHYTPPILWQPNDRTEPQIEFHVHITHSQVDVACNVNDWQAVNHSGAYWHAVALATAAVDLVAFSLGAGVTIYFHTFIGPTGLPGQLNVRPVSRESLCTVFNVSSVESAEANTDFDQMYRTVLSDPWLFIALNDLILAYLYPNQSTINCARVMDSIRQMLARGAKRKIVGWHYMHDTLNIQQKYIEWISDQSKLARHGDRTHIPPVVVLEAYRRSSIVMNRFLEYRKRGNAPLPLDEFPTLIHDPVFDLPPTP